jgi:uncharacterized membrane protein
MIAEQTMTQSTSPPDAVSVVISGNSSLSAAGTWLFYGSIVAFTVIISGGWALMGYWPVLPFAGLELAVLALALYLTRLRATYREVLVISATDVVLERGRATRRESLQWPRPWVRAELASGPSRRSRLLLRSSGRSVEIASMLTEPERKALHARLRELL